MGPLLIYFAYMGEWVSTWPQIINPPSNYNNFNAPKFWQNVVSITLHGLTLSMLFLGNVMRITGTTFFVQSWSFFFFQSLTCVFGHKSLNWTCNYVQNTSVTTGPWICASRPNYTTIFIYWLLVWWVFATRSLCFLFLTFD